VGSALLTYADRVRPPRAAAERDLSSLGLALGNWRS
jgi:hypothetical protein